MSTQLAPSPESIPVGTLVAYDTPAGGLFIGQVVDHRQVTITTRSWTAGEGTSTTTTPIGWEFSVNPILDPIAGRTESFYTDLRQPMWRIGEAAQPLADAYGIDAGSVATCDLCGRSDDHRHDEDEYGLPDTFCTECGVGPFYLVAERDHPGLCLDCADDAQRCIRA